MDLPEGARYLRAQPAWFALLKHCDISGHRQQLQQAEEFSS